MKICFVGPANSAHIVKWSSWFRKAGHEVYIISFIRARVSGAHVYYINTNASADGSDLSKIKYLFAGKRIKAIIDKIRPDIVNVHYATSYGAAIALSGVKDYILSVWGSDIYDFPNKSPLHKALLRFSLNKAKWLFSTSRAMADEAGKYTDKKFEITPFGVDTGLFAPDKKTGKAHDSFVVGTVKGLSDKYGIRDILYAVQKVRNDRPDIDIRLRIAGKGPQEEEYRLLSKQLGIDDITDWLGFISQEDAAREWADMDIALIPSTLESFGVSAVEAQACGTAVIISDIPGLMESTSPGVTSVVVKRNDPAMLAKAITELYDDPERRLAMGDNGRRYVRDNYSLDVCFGNIEKLYMKYVSESKTRRRSRCSEKKGEEIKKCIFYLPYELEEHGVRARMLRPIKMIQGFRDIGYDVFVIEGFSKERKAKISELKRSVLRGDKYDFMYTESSTMPTLLTDPNHLPLHPFMDFGFFRFLKKHGIKIGLFYCDVYWKFDSYGKDLSDLKKHAALMNYRYDIRKYKQLLDKFYVPDMKMCDHVGEPVLTRIASELPPASDNIDMTDKAHTFDGRIGIFYVGGLGNNYQITELAKAVKNVPDSELTICCRNEEWEKEKESFLPYMCDRITIIHKSSDELEPYYRRADLCSVLFRNSEYIDMARPVKAYEYLAHELPVLSTRGTAIGRFVEENDIGWNIEYSSEAIEKVLHEILRDPEILKQKTENCKKAKKENLWSTRARKVADDLT